MVGSSPRTSQPVSAAAIGPAAPVAIALAGAMLLGGSGSLVPLPEIILQCLLAALFSWWVWLRPQALRQVPRSAWIIAALMLAVPMSQLLPLPPELWHSLPGRFVEKAALELVGQGSSWQPLSLTVNRTLAALLVMAAVAAMLVMAAAQDRRGRTILLATVSAMALLSVLVGAKQISGGDTDPWRIYSPDNGLLTGFQANHNAEADVLLIGLVAVAAVAADWAMLRKPPVQSGLLLGMVGGASLLLLLGVILTGSRTGIALLPVAVGAQGLILRRWLRLDWRRLMVGSLAVIAAVAFAAGLSGQHHGAWERAWSRFHTLADLRPDIWRDSLFALRQYWPWGAGMGSFIPVFAAAERLEIVTNRFVNRAHDDYLEFVIEAGLPGIVALGLICCRIARDAWHGWRARRVDPASNSRSQLIFGAASLCIVGLHSLGDYPLRTMALACMMSVSAGLLLPIAAMAEGGIVKQA